MNIRTAVSSDASSIRKLLVQLGYPTLNDDETNKKISLYTKANYELLVSEHEGVVTGFISLHWFDIFHSPGMIGRITAFCIDENYRSKGVGQKLLEVAEEFLVSKGCTKIEVTSNEKRLRTHDFYLRAGYIEDSRRFVKYPKA